VNGSDPRLLDAPAVEPGGGVAGEPRGPAAPEPRGTAGAIGQSAPNVELHIEELVLHGFPPSERQRIGEALRAELARLFAERGAPPRLAKGLRRPEIDVGAFEVGAETRAEAIGRRVARRVYEGLGA
jgi:hypothetical protein